MQDWRRTPDSWTRTQSGFREMERIQHPDFHLSGTPVQLPAALLVQCLSKRAAGSGPWGKCAFPFISYHTLYSTTVVTLKGSLLLIFTQQLAPLCFLFFTIFSLFQASIVLLRHAPLEPPTPTTTK